MIGGVHGVGKTQICKNLVKHIPDISYVSASKLISHFSAIKYVNDIRTNQLLLTERIRAIKDENELTLVDGHFCVADKGGEMKYVGEDIFRIITPELLVLVDAPSTVIQKRILLRDNIEYPIALIDRWLHEEAYWAIYTSTQLDIPLIKINGITYN